MGNDKSKPTLPEIGFLRLTQIIGDAKADPPIPAIIPVSRSTWWAGVKSGRYPRQRKLGPKISVWPVESIQELIDRCKRETE
jgi:prophage regulatory protein